MAGVEKHKKREKLRNEGGVNEDETKSYVFCKDA